MTYNKVIVGYEDGHVFEEIIEVKMDKIEQPAVSEKEILAAMAAQQ